MDNADSRLEESDEPVFDSFPRSVENGFFLKYVIYTVLLILFHYNLLF